MKPIIAVIMASAAGAARHWRLLLPMFVAAVSAVFAWIAGSAYLRDAEARIARHYAERHETREFVVAARRLEPGMRLETALLARRRVPVRFAPKSAFRPEQLDDLLGRELAQSVDAGDILIPGVLRDPIAPALATRLAAGERALTIAVDDTNSHAGLLRPGDLVDLLFLSADDSGATHSAQVRPLLQAVRVLATGRTVVRMAGTASGDDEATRNFSTVTLQLTARDAERIALAQRTGELLVSLRAAGDTERTHHGPLGLAALLSDGAPRSLARTATSSRQVDGWIGGHEGRWVRYRWRVTTPVDGDLP